MSDKPIIAHCKNCIYGEKGMIFDAYCGVKYKWIRHERLAALFCKYFKTHNGLAVLFLHRKDKTIEAQAETIAKKYTCEGCSGCCNCFENDKKCDYYKEHYDWVKSVLTSGSRT